MKTIASVEFSSTQYAEKICNFRLRHWHAGLSTSTEFCAPAADLPLDIENVFAKLQSVQHGVVHSSNDRTVSTLCRTC